MVLGMVTLDQLERARDLVFLHAFNTTRLSTGPGTRSPCETGYYPATLRVEQEWSWSSVLSEP
jgi:hypothetical protein